MPQLHRNSQKRFYGPDKIYFIVTKTYKNYPYFKEPIFCDLFLEELKLGKKLKQFKLYGFCLVYDHLNLLIGPREKYNISQVMKSLKENISRDINYIMANRHYEGDTSTCRLPLRRLIAELQKQFIDKYGEPQYARPRFKWQKSFHDHVIRDEKDFANHYTYTVDNYAKHNLPEDWRYTSSNFEDLIDY